MLVLRKETQFLEYSVSIKYVKVTNKTAGSFHYFTHQCATAGNQKWVNRAPILGYSRIVFLKTHWLKKEALK